ncbi:MAG: hypothetical protein ACOYMR_18685 [Ilumatobacteraceae bacterium]
MSARQQVLMLWLASSSLDSRVLGWSFFDGTAGEGPQLEADPPYATGVAALQAGWRLLQMSPLIAPTPGHERDTSFLKHEFVFERLVDTAGDGSSPTNAPTTGRFTPDH